MAKHKLQRPRGFYKRGNMWWFCRGKIRTSTGHYDLGDAIDWVNSRPDIYMRERHKPVCQINPFTSEPFEFTGQWVRNAAKKTEYKNGRGRGLSEDEVRTLVARANGRCELTGIPFSGADVEGISRRPFIPSIDRVKPGLPYSIANCRLVCFSVNAALNEWGDDVFDIVCLGRCTYRLAAMVPQSFVAQNHNQLIKQEKEGVSYSLTHDNSV